MNACEADAGRGSQVGHEHLPHVVALAPHLAECDFDHEYT